MKNLITILLSIFTSILSAATFETISYTFNIEYPTQADAQAVQAQITQFPNNKKYAFSSRWDDTNPRHIQMQEMLSQRGCNGTFYIVGDISKKPNDLKLCKDLLAKGGAIASHTISHTNVSKVSGNVCFYQMMMERIFLETALDTSVVGFVLPNTDYKNVADPRASEVIGECFWRAGYIITPQELDFDIDSYKIPVNKLLVHTPCFAVNDRAPDEELFKTSLEQTMASDMFKKNKHLTLGIHTWQTDEGLQKLGKIIDKHITDDFWKPNANELASYLIQYKNSKIKKIAVNDKIATFEITRISTTHLGSDIPLYISFSKADKNGRNFIELTQSQLYSTPKKIDHIACEFDNNNTSKKFECVSATLKINNNQLALEGVFTKNISNPTVKFRLPPNYEMPVACKLSPDNNNHFKVSSELKLNDKYTDLFTGKATFVAQIDFLHNNVPARLYVSTSLEKETHQMRYARDNAISSPYLSKKEYTEADIIEFSKNNKPLPKNFKWVKNNPNNNPYTMSIRFKWNKQKDEWLFAIADIETPRTDFYEIRTLNTNKVRGVYVNGEKITNYKKVKLQKGLNRILVNLESLQCGRLQYLPLSVCDNKKHLQLKTPIMK